MNTDTFKPVDQAESSKSGIIHPSHAASRRVLGPVFYLAHKMARSDNEALRKETKIVDDLAKRAGVADYRIQKWYTELTEEKAIAALSGDEAKRCCMVVLTLVLKADGEKKPEEHAFFSKIRTSLGAPPIVVPVSLEDHKKLAYEYATVKGK